MATNRPLVADVYIKARLSVSVLGEGSCRSYPPWGNLGDNLTQFVLSKAPMQNLFGHMNVGYVHIPS